MLEKIVDIASPDGTINTRICHPDEGGPFPAILFFMDAPGVRPELQDMAMRLATVGYYVVLPNLYYRTDRAVEFPPDKMDANDGALRKQMIAKVRGLTVPMLLRDTEALLRFLDAQPEARPGPIGALGYCMSGRWVFSAAAAHPDRIAAAASVYGTGLVTDSPESPHLTASRIRGEIYFACAENDSYVPQTQIEALERHMAGTPVRHRIEVYPGTQHGFVFPERGHYQRAGAERHWSRLFALFDRNLKGRST